MNSDAKYFRTGLFVIIAFLILLIGIFSLGAKSWFEPQVTFETYFDTSIGGLTVGSPVKYRGVQLGKVTKIDFVHNLYPDTLRDPNNFNYILVEFQIEKRLLAGLMQGNFQNNINRAVERGLRIRVDMSGIAGGNYLEMDRLDSRFTAELLPINWTPRNYYIPSSKSAITQIVNSLNQTLRNLGRVDFDELQKKMVSLIDQVDRNSQQFNVLIDRINQIDIAGTLNNVRIITEELKDTSSRIKNDPSQILWSSPPPPAKSLDTNK